MRINPKDIKAGARFQWLRDLSVTIEVLHNCERYPTRWLVKYPNGHQKWWSQSHLRKYYRIEQ